MFSSVIMISKRFKDYNISHNRMKIIINSKENKKLLQNFPDDPYSDITILTQYSKLNLVLAYLSIDSEYFANLDPATKQINLSHFHQQPLIKVLKSLYGAELSAYSVQQLFALYEIIEQLEIDEYKILLRESLHQILANQKDSPILNSIEMLQFCINKKILVREMKNFHFDTKLKILQSSKNYLQLNKLSQTTLSSLLLDFHAPKIEKGDQIINHILQNYFNRKNIRPAFYFANESLEELKNIWEKFHHKITINSQLHSSPEDNKSATLSNTVGNLSYVNSLDHIQTQMRKSQTNLEKMLKIPFQTVKPKIFKSEKQIESQMLDSKILTLQEQLRTKDDLIKRLRTELKSLKQNKQLIEVNGENEDNETNLVCDLEKIQKNKETAIKIFDNVRQAQSFEVGKDLNNLSKVFGKNGANKRIFQQGFK